MKKIFSLLTAVLFAGAMMATDVAVTIHASSGDYYAKDNSWTNATQYDQVVLDENITANRIGTGDNGKYYSDWRFYTNGSESGSFSIDAATGYELQTVTFTYTVSNSGALYMGETKLTSKTAVEVSGQKAVFQCKNTNTSTNGQVRLTAIAVTYQAAVTPPVATTMTVYCKNVQSWWTADGAAVGVHYWGGASAGTAWPGVRMAPVAGQEGLWSYDVPADITGLIFVRVNGTGDVTDWGAKTADLTLPTDGKNLYTITSTSAVWGDPGVTGEWSVYGNDPTPVDPPTPEKKLPVVVLAGTMNGWSTTANVMTPAADSLTASVTVALEAGKDTFKIVSDDKWLSLNGEGETLYGFHRDWTTASHVNGVDVRNFELTADVAGDYTFTWTYADSTLAITFPKKQVTPIDAEKYIVHWDATPENVVGQVILHQGAAKATTKIHTNTDNLDAINLSSSYAYASDKYVVIKPATGAFKAGDVVEFATLINNATGDGSKWGRVQFYAADGATKLFEGQDGINGRLVNDEPILEQFTLEADQDSILLGRYGNTATFISVLNVGREGGVTPPPTPTLENGFYLIGQKGWDAAALDASLKFAANPDNENEYVLTTTLVKDQHLKVVKVENDALVAWYPDGMDNDYVVDAAHAGENKDIYFQETYKADWADFGGYFWTGSNEPAGCNWDAIEFLGTTDLAYANQFKLCKTGDYPGVVNIQQPGFATEIGIYVTFPSDKFGEISLPATAYDIQGTGIIFHLSAFTAVETEVTVVCQSNPIVFTVYNAKGGVTPPPTGVEIRLVPTIWNVDGAKFAAVTWKVGEVMESSAAVLTDWFVGGDTVVGYIPADADSIAFARFAAGTATPSLDMSTIWNHSDKLAIDPSMIYTITAWGKESSPGYWGEAPQPVEAEWFLAGDMTDWQNGKLSFKNGDIKVTLADAGRTYGFKIVKVEGENMTWYGNNGTMTREYNQDWVFDNNEQSNGKLTTDVAGEYTFKLVVDGIGMPHVSVTYPNGTGMQLINANDAAVKSMLNGQVVIIRGEHIYTPAGQMIK